MAGQALNSEVRKTYYPDGQLKTISSYESGKMNGIERRYNEKGVLIEAVNYCDNKIDGFKNVYYPNGALWRKELYENGRIVERIEFDEEGRMTLQEDLQ